MDGWMERTGGWMDKLNGWLVYGGMDDVNHHCMRWMDVNKNCMRLMDIWRWTD